MSGNLPPQGPPPGQPPGQPPSGQVPPLAGSSAPGAPIGHYPAVPPPPYTSWIRRVASGLVDAGLLAVAIIPFMSGAIWLSASSEPYVDYTGTTQYQPHANLAMVLLMVIGGLLYLAVFVWNVCLRQGRTGRTVGKSLLGTTLISESTGRPIGAGLAFVRQIAHFLDGLCYIGYLWPLWDPKRQTFADKVMSTVVIDSAPQR